ncbi:hypothetical protein [Nocardioides eburneiflavus]|uniref:hypothetical protein n=1 Tax=Nocardioides eburneiflavus TaxID=2518372 RepID=UPI001FEBDBD9|nr:hypothetical protein [Nocardioides eburneiflavus]
MTETWPGAAYPLGATFDGTGTNFALFSEVAERVELCLFDPDPDPGRLRGDEGRRHRGRRLRVALLPPHRAARPASTATASTAVGPDEGPALQPEQAAARPLREGHAGEIDWDQSLFSYNFGDEDSKNEDDSAAHMTHGVVINPFFDWEGDRASCHPLQRVLHLRGARQGAHPAPPRRPRGAARDVRRAGAPGDHRPPQEARRHRHRADAGDQFVQDSTLLDQGCATTGATTPWPSSPRTPTTPRAPRVSRSRSSRRWSRRCTPPASRSSSTWSTTTPPRATTSARR